LLTAVKGLTLQSRSATDQTPVEVSRVIEQASGRYRACYEEGLRTNPSLAGRVSIRLEIERDGSVTRAEDAGSNLPDASVVQCVVHRVGSLTFPRHEGDRITVVHPVFFGPRE
jgi:hypothetical protein